ARVRRQVSAELTRSFRAQAERKQPVDVCSRVLNLREHAAGLRDQREIVWVDGPNAPHACERDDDLRAVRAGRAATAIARVAAHGYDTDARLVAGPQDAGNLFRRARTQHQRCLASVELAMVDSEGFQIGGLVEIAVPADHLAPRISNRTGNAHVLIISKRAQSDHSEPAAKDSRSVEVTIFLNLTTPFSSTQAKCRLVPASVSTLPPMSSAAFALRRRVISNRALRATSFDSRSAFWQNSCGQTCAAFGVSSRSQPFTTIVFGERSSPGSRRFSSRENNPHRQMPASEARMKKRSVST